MYESSQSSFSDKSSGGGRRGGAGGADSKPRRGSGAGGRVPLDVVIDYKNPQTLKQFISDRGKILPRRLSGANPKQQRRLALAIKRARAIALLPFAAE